YADRPRCPLDPRPTDHRRLFVEREEIAEHGREGVALRRRERPEERAFAALRPGVRAKELEAVPRIVGRHARQRPGRARAAGEEARRREEVHAERRSAPPAFVSKASHATLPA